MNRLLFPLVPLILIFILSLCQTAVADSPILFTENKGQWEKDILYRVQTPGGFLILKKHALLYVLYDTKNLPDRHASSHQASPEPSARQPENNMILAHGVEVAFENASHEVNIIAENPVVTKFNYFLGNNPDHWASDVSGYTEIVYNNIYDGINFRIFGYESVLKYEFIVNPGADPAKIKMHYQDASQIKINDKGQLEIHTEAGMIKEAAPFSYQTTGSKKTEVTSSYQLNGNHLTFQLGKNYDQSRTLIIDPELIFSTFSGSLADNWGHTATYDDLGNLYSAGTVFDVGFPATRGVYQVNFASIVDVGILKFSSDGRTLLYATYLGGNNTDLPNSMIVNKKGELLVFGTTSSTNFSTSPNAFQKNFAGGTNTTPISGLVMSNGTDIFVSKLSSDGRTLLASTYVGGRGNDGLSATQFFEIRNYGDSFRGEIIVDQADQVWVTTSTSSNNFPLRSPSQTELLGNQDAVVFQLSDDLSELMWSTYFGGSKSDAANSIKVTKDNQVYITGQTRSPDLDKTTGTVKDNLSGGEDGYVAHFANRQLQKVSYLGTSEADGAYLVDLDPAGNVHVLGLSKGKYPITSGTYTSGAGQFIHALNPTLTQTIFSTTIGSSSVYPDISPTAFLVNDCGNIYIAGWGGDVNIQNGDNIYSTSRGLPITTDALQNTTSNHNFYIAILEAGAKSLLYGTYFGSSAAQNPVNERGDHVDGGTSRFDKNGVIYHATCACGGSRFPTTPQAWSNTNRSTNCNIAAFKIDIDHLKAAFDVYEGSKKDVVEGCAPLDLKFVNQSYGGDNYIWEINGNGISRDEVQASHKFDKAGEYEVKLRAFNRLTCTREDVATRVIKVVEMQTKVSADTTVCSNHNVMLSASGGDEYIWTPASSLNNGLIANPIAKVSKTTVFSVEIKNNAGCSVKKDIKVTIDNNKPDFGTSPDIAMCPDGKVTLQAFGNASKFQWFKEGQLIATGRNQLEVSPEVTTVYEVIGEYPDQCNPVAKIQVTVDRTFLPEFDIKRVSYNCNEYPTYQFVNHTNQAKTYHWDIGDGHTHGTRDLDDIRYNQHGAYIITLTTTSENGCSMSKSKSFNVEPILEIPNVITPNGDGKNDTFVIPLQGVKVEIYNRWGLQLLSTTDYQNNWGNGIVNGTYFYEVITPGGTQCKGWIQVLE